MTKIHESFKKVFNRYSSMEFCACVGLGPLMFILGFKQLSKEITRWAGLQGFPDPPGHLQTLSTQHGHDLDLSSGTGTTQ